MPKREDSNSKFDPMHRIVGAVILVTLAVVFVPMVLREQVPPETDRESLPPASEGETKVMILPLESPKPRVQQDRPVSEYAQDRTVSPLKTPAEPEPAESTAIATPSDATLAPTPKPAAKPASTAAIDKGWVIQMGTYSNPDNASRVHTQLKQLGYVVTLEDIQLKTGKATRVRVGPYVKKTQAITTKAELQKQIGLKGVVLAYP